MNLSSLNQIPLNPLRRSTPSFKQAQDQNQTSPLQDNRGELKNPGAEILKAYSGLAVEKTVSREDFLAYLTETKAPRPDRYEEMVDALTDKDGQISQKGLDIFKNFRAKRHMIFDSVRVFNTAKEDGKINYSALKMVDSVMAQQSLYSSYSSAVDYSKILTDCKDKSGKFDPSPLALFDRHGEVFKLNFSRGANYIFKALKNNDGELSKESISFMDVSLSNGKKMAEILAAINEGKDSSGNFSYAQQKANDELKDVFTPEQLTYLKYSSKDFAPEKKEKLMKLATKIKDEKEFSTVLSFIEKMNVEPSNCGIDYDEKSVNHFKKLLEAVYKNEESVEIITKKLNMPVENYTQEVISAINRLVGATTKENFGLFIDAATYKNGDKKGQFSPENLNRYLDIQWTRGHGSTELVQKVSSCLSLEDDDRALKLFHKLYTMKWPPEKHYGSESKIDVNSINFVLDLCTHAIKDKPEIKCSIKAIERIEKLLEMKLPMTSAKVFDNFMVFSDYKDIAKLERVNFGELGLDSEQMTSGFFQGSDEPSLMKLKEFLTEYVKDKNVSEINIQPNANVVHLVEISSGLDWDKRTLFYDLKSGVPATEERSCETQNRLYKTQKDYQNNSEVELVYDLKKLGFGKYETLKSQNFRKFDEDGNLLYTEIMEKSGINGVFNIKRIYPDGHEDVVCQAGRDGETGNETIEKNMLSFDGTKSYYRYEDDKDGNRIIDYKITDENGKSLLNQSITFEVLDENHFVSSRNNKKFDIRIDGDILTVKNLQTGESEKIELENFTKSTQEQILPMLKQMPGEELMEIKKLDLKSIYNEKIREGAFFRSDGKEIREIGLGNDFLNLSILLHELGHGKDELKFKEISQEIYKDERLKEIYNQEKQNFRANFSDSQLTHIGYFAADSHYLGASRAIKEGVAETNSLLSTYPKNDVQATRAHFWQQYFPKTIAYLAKLI